MKTIIQIVFITISFLVTGCVASQIKGEGDIYTILNVKINSLTNKKNDTIYIRKQTFNKHLKRLLKEKKLISRIENLELIEIFTNEQEINYMTGQLKDGFLIDFTKIKSKLVKKYIDPFERLDSSGNIITDYYYIKIFGSRKYSFSKPIFSKNRNYSFLIISMDSVHITLKVYIRKNNQWIFLRNIGLGIS